MAKNFHEIRDAVHVFDRLDSEERKVLDSRPFQRLRHIHQLAMTYLVYPGATHCRFEHSLGVMELADRVYRIITAEDNRDRRLEDFFPGGDQIGYWRRVLRMAALCHDMGHLPFSHAAEHELLPKGKSHENITQDIIESPDMRCIWESLVPPLNAEHIAKLAIGPEKFTDSEFSDWERILSEVVVGDSFGVDRMDYLLRDSLHTGVVYGKFDQYRLIDTLRILPESEESSTPALGIESGGLESAEALLLARYFMYSQVYFHPVRRVYDVHLKDFMIARFGRRSFPTDVEKFLEITDNEVMVELRKVASDADSLGHEPARRILNREHYRLLYRRNPNDIVKNPDAATAIAEAAESEFGEERVKLDAYRQKSSVTDFPVRSHDGRIYSSIAQSDVLKKVPLVAIDYVFVDPDVKEDAVKWLEENRETILSAPVTEEDEA